MDSKVTGLGGVFITSEDPKKLTAWYDRHLGLTFGGQSYLAFRWKDNVSGEPGTTAFSVFKKDTDYFKPSGQKFMVNFRVNDLENLINELRTEGTTIVGDIDSTPYGKFAWILDPDGNKIELWEPPAAKKADDVTP